VEFVQFKHRKDIQQQKAIVPNACSVYIYIFSHETINNTKDVEMKLHVSKGEICSVCVCLHSFLMFLGENGGL